MKLKLWMKLAEKLLQINHADGEPRADMYLPERVLAIGIVLLALAIVMAVRLAVAFQIGLLVLTLALAALGLGAVLCWRNQTIRIVDDESFIYTTFLGHSREYHFSQITRMIRNRDSFTLMLGSDKVHIESGAILSDALIDRINQALEQAG